MHLLSRLEDWRHWFELHGYPNDICAVTGVRYELFSMLIEAACAGLGVALVPRYMVHTQLQVGILVQPLAHSLPGQTAYYLVYPQEHANLAVLSAFRGWLLGTTQAWLQQNQPEQARSAALVADGAATAAIP
jgi:DNA-binding transcriptional LysR family regulator